MRCAWLLLVLMSASLSAQALDTSSVGWEQHRGERLPLQLEFNDESGASVPLSHYFGRIPVILVFVYFSCPALCPVTLAGVTEALQGTGLQPGRDYALLAISIDPKDTPAMATQQKTHLIADEPLRQEVHFLTSAGDAARKLAHSVGFNYQYDAEHAQFAHAAGFLIADQQGVISRYFFGVRYPSAQVRTSVIEAGQGRVGSLAERLRLLCYHFDPVQGHYSVAIMNLLRIFAIGCALTCATLAWRYLGRGKRVS
jgi:protein SCO1/2